MTLHPPKPRLALSIGVIGHRPNRLPAGARAEVDAHVNKVMDLVWQSAQAAHERHKQIFTDGLPAPILLSALAEGADQIAAAAGLDKGYALTAVLPFEIEEYARDFRDLSSKTEYRRLLNQAERTLILPGERALEALAYEAAGLTILGNADILLAVWDGEASAGRGGTTELVERAARDDIPVVHVDAKGEHAPRLLWSGLAEFPASGADILDLPSFDLGSALPDVIDTLVRPPSDRVEYEKLCRYLGETWKSWNWRLEVPLLLAILGLRPLRKTDVRPKEATALAAGFQSHVSSPGPKQPDETRAYVLPPAALAFGWADALGIRYAQFFRGAYISNFLSSAVAVLAGATSLVGTRLFAWPSPPLALVEGVLVAFIFLNTLVGRKRDWHSRWRESREVAERLRAAEPLWLVAQRSVSSPAGEATWTAWYVRAQVRALGIIAGALDETRREDIRQSLIAVVDAQHAYHAHVAGLMRSVERRIERLGQVLFMLTIIFAAVTLTTAWIGMDLPVNWTYVLTGLTAALPALGAATFGIRLIGDFEGVAQRSERTGAVLAGLGGALRQDPPKLAVLRSRAHAVANAMLGDVSHWRMTTETRKLVAPG